MSVSFTENEIEIESSIHHLSSQANVPRKNDRCCERGKIELSSKRRFEDEIDTFNSNRRASAGLPPSLPPGHRHNNLPPILPQDNKFSHPRDFPSGLSPGHNQNPSNYSYNHNLPLCVATPIPADEIISDMPKGTTRRNHLILLIFSLAIFLIVGLTVVFALQLKNNKSPQVVKGRNQGDSVDIILDVDETMVDSDSSSETAPPSSYVIEDDPVTSAPQSTPIPSFRPAPILDFDLYAFDGDDDDLIKGFDHDDMLTNPMCSDKTHGGNEWHDADGKEYNCDWYSSVDGRKPCKGSNCCYEYGDGLKKYGMTANQACCVCGGGIWLTSEPSSVPP